MSNFRTIIDRLNGNQIARFILIGIVNTAFSYSFIDAADNFYPNKNATRGEIFNMAKRILKSKT